MTGIMSPEQIEAYVGAKRRHEADIVAFIAIIAGSKASRACLSRNPHIKARVDRLVGVMLELEENVAARRVWNAYQDLLVFFGTEYAEARMQRRDGAA